MTGTPTSPETAPTTEQTHESILNNWKERFEDLLKAKSLDDLKAELTDIATDIQS